MFGLWLIRSTSLVTWRYLALQYASMMEGLAAARQFVWSFKGMEHGMVVPCWLQVERIRMQLGCVHMR